MQLYVPELETERLKLRAYLPTDLPDAAKMFDDPEVVRYLGGKTISRQDTYARLLTLAGHWAFFDFGYWAVTTKENNQFIGIMGYADFKRDMTPSIEGFPEIGWVLARHAQGKGYALEALQAITKWGDAKFKDQKTVCIIDPNHVRSLRLAEKLGYHVRGRGIFRGEETLVLERLA